MLRLCIFLSLIFWAKSDSENECITFTRLGLKDSSFDMFKPKLKILLLLYTRKSSNCPQRLFKKNYVLNNNFNITKKTVWIIHGYRPFGETPVWLNGLIKGLLAFEDVNVIVVDWNKGAATLFYPMAIKKCRMVAEVLKYAIKRLMMNGVSVKSFHFIGVSLGAHISGYVGSIFKGQFKRITGIDPAGPGFRNAPSEKILDYTDAKFVDIIHSDIDGLGISRSTGHIDFYPNGGKIQPGCPTTIFSGIRYVKCDHERAVFLFISSLSANCNLTAYTCKSYEEFKHGICTNCQAFGLETCPTIGLDPAGPIFSGKPPHKRLDYTDAQFVDVIHSDSNALGIKQPLGHIDFYPNGGKSQPGCPKSIFSGASFIKCDHQRAVYLFMTSLETKCDLTAYPCMSHRDYRNGKCILCEEFKPKSCPKVGYYVDQWKDILIKRQPPGINVYFDTADKEPFCMYHYILDIVILDNVSKDGYLKIKLIDIYGKVENSKIKNDMVTYPIYEEVSVLAGFYYDFKDISKIVLTYSQRNMKFKCSKCNYKIHHIKLRSLTNPERPQLCKYDFVLKENVETSLKPLPCTSANINTK